MVTVKFDTSEETYNVLQQIAEQEQTTVESILSELTRLYISQHESPVSATEEEIDYPEWLKPGLFNSGYSETGRHADEILAEEWNPDPRD